MRDTTRDVHAQLKALRLNGMAIAWGELMEQGGDTVDVKVVVANYSMLKRPIWSAGSAPSLFVG